MLDIAWAAGIWEGEGSIWGARPSRPSFAVNVTQKDRWILDKLKELFGGGVYLRSPNSKNVCHTWTCSGPRAFGFIYTIFSFLSPRRREQVKKFIVAHLERKR